MPTPRTWLPRVEEILNLLRTSTLELYDRASIETIFQIQRRSALLLIKQVGPIKQGMDHFVARSSLLRWVEQIEATEGQALSGRRQMIAQVCQDLQEQEALRRAAAPTKFPIVREMMQAHISSLPDAIRITPGNVSVNFPKDDPVKACELLYYLGLALANDFETFAHLMSASKNASSLAGMPEESQASLPASEET